MADVVFRAAKVNKFIKQIDDRFQMVGRVHQFYAKAISPFVYKDILDHFKKREGPNGSWPAWSEAYENAQVKRSRSETNMLQDTGFLKKNVRPKNWRKDGAGELEWFNPAKNEDGEPYAMWHDEGFEDIPQRQFMWLSKQAFEQIGRVTLEFMVKGYL